MLCLLYFIGKNYRADFTTDRFYYLKFPDLVYNKKGNRGPSLHSPHDYTATLLLYQKKI